MSSEDLLPGDIVSIGEQPILTTALLPFRNETIPELLFWCLSVSLRSLQRG